MSSAMIKCTARSVSENDRNTSQIGGSTLELPERSCDNFVDPRPSVRSSTCLVSLLKWKTLGKRKRRVVAGRVNREQFQEIYLNPGVDPDLATS